MAIFGIIWQDILAVFNIFWLFLTFQKHYRTILYVLAIFDISWATFNNLCLVTLIAIANVCQPRGHLLIDERRKKCAAGGTRRYIRK